MKKKKLLKLIKSNYVEITNLDYRLKQVENKLDKSLIAEHYIELQKTFSEFSKEIIDITKDVKIKPLERQSENNTFETLADWQRLFPKSLTEFNSMNYYGFDVEIWNLLSDILDYFDEKGYNFENYKDTEYKLYWYRVNDKDYIKGNTRREAFSNCLFELLQDYENTL